jgi:hypothetical protein
MSVHVFQERLLWAKVNKTDTCWEWTASKNSNGYGKFVVFTDGKHRSMLAHRVTYQMLVGEIPEGASIDHICHNPSCVNPDHLRPASAKQNLENRRSANSNSVSGVRGVSWSKRSRKWRTTVMHHGRQHSAGNHDDLSEAEAAVIELRNRLHTYNDVDRH